MILTLREPAQVEPAVAEGNGKATTPDGPDGTNAEVFAAVVKFVQGTNTMKDVEHLVGAEPEAHDFFLSLGFKDTKYAGVNLSQWAPKYSGFSVFRFSKMVKSHE
ncbi:unnamed protein product [Sphagnum balticum]